MFKELLIELFQSHERTHLEFSPFVNVIVGMSTSGKTAIRRAINLVAKNRPSGARFYSKFSKDLKKPTHINIKFDNGEIDLIKKVKLDKQGKIKIDKTSYQVITNNQTFNFPEGIGDSVPDQVSDLINMNELNIQGQFDPHFLIGNETSGGAAARIINKITNMDQVHIWTSKLTTRINESQKRVLSLQSDISLKEAELQKYEGIDLVGRIIKKIESLVQKNDELTRQIQTLTDLLSNYRFKSNILKRLREFEKVEEHIIKAKKLQEDIDETNYLQLQVETLKKLQKAIRFQSSFQKPLQLLLKRISSIVEDEGVVQLQKGLENLKRLKKIQDRIGPFQYSFSDLICRIKDIKIDDQEIFFLKNALSRLKLLRDDKRKDETTYRTQKDQYMEIFQKNKICSRCLSKLDSKQIKLIEGNL